MSIADDGDLLRQPVVPVHGRAGRGVAVTGSLEPAERLRRPRRRRAERRAVAPARPRRRPGDTRRAGNGSDVVVPIIVALIVLGAGAAYLLTRRNRPTDADVTRGWRGRLAARVGCDARPRVRARPGPPRGGGRAHAQPDLREPAAAGGLPRRRRADGRPVVRVRDRPRRPGDAARPRPASGTLPPAWLRYLLRAIGLVGWVWIIAQGIAGGSSDADVSSLFLWVYGWVGLAIVCAIDRAGLAVPRPVLDAPRPGRGGPAGGCTSRAGRSPTIRRGSGAGRRPSASRSSSGSSSS